jgi:Caspase domain/TIR domain
MSKIVISYRRSSYDAIVGRIRDKLVSHYGDDAVYMDVDNIPYGIDFRQHINKALNEGDVVIAIIGPKWVGPMRGRKARIFDDADPVRVEIETALNRGIAVVPILVDGAKMPKQTDLPESISQLAFHNAATVDAGRDFHQHMDRVIRSMEMVVVRPVREKGVARLLPIGRKRLAVAASAMAAVVALAVGIYAGQPFFSQRFGSPAVSDSRAVDPVPPVPPVAEAVQAPKRTEPARPVTSVAAKMGRRVALVIGNAAYVHASPLKNTVHDAVAVSDLLRSLDFSVITRTDIGTREFANALRAFRDEAAKADIAAVYYAGHAVEVSGTNYLIPTDARVDSEADLLSEATALDAIFSAIEGARKLRLVFLDACRDNPFARALPTGGRGLRSVVVANAPTRAVTLDRGLAPVEVKLQNTLIAFAAKAGSVALDGEGIHSPFAAALLQHLGTPNLDIRIVLGRVRDDVFNSTQGKQEPYFYGSLGGDVFALAEAK